MKRLYIKNYFTFSKFIVCFYSCLFSFYPLFVDAAPTTLTYSVSQTNDDAEEQGPFPGTMESLSSSDLEIVYESGSTEQVIGVRFQGITITQGATSITNAYIQFQADNTNSGTTNVLIFGEGEDTTIEFSSSNGDISTRTRTTAEVLWTGIPAWNTVGAAGTDQRTPDISSIISEIVQRPGWSHFNSIVIMIESDTGCSAPGCEREAESFDGTAAPQLVITLDDSEVDTSLPTFPPPVAGTCYAVSDSTNELVLVKSSGIGAGSGTLIGSVGVPDIEAATYDTSANVLYAADADQLGWLNPTTGTFTALIATFGTGTGNVGSVNFNDVDGLTYDITNDKIYGSMARGGNDVIIEINKISGAHVPLAFNGGTDDYLEITGASGEVDDIAINPLDGKIYIVTDGSPEFYEVDLTTGAATSMGNISGATDIEGMDFDDNGVLYGTTGAGALFEIPIVNNPAAIAIGSGFGIGGDYEALSCVFGIGTFDPQICSTSFLTDDMNGISGSSDDFIIAVGKRDSNYSQIWEYDGTNWVRQGSTVNLPNEDLKDVQVINTTTAFAVGNKGGGKGTFLVRDGSGWTDESSNLPSINQDMLGVWSDTATEVFIGGKKDGNDGKMILCEDSGGWSCIDLENNVNDNRNQDIEDVWGDGSNVYFLDKRGRLFIFDRSGISDPTNTSYWTEDNSCENLSSNSDFRDLWGDGAGNIYLTGKGKATGSNLATVWKYDGSSCSVVIETATENDMNGGIYGSTVTGDIYAGGKGGLVLFSNDNGVTWSETTSGVEDIKDVWVSDTGNPYFAGKNGEVTTCSGGGTVTVDHYAISYPLGSPGVTCEALAVRITAHEDASDHSMIVAPSSSTTITLSTSPATDSWTFKSGNGTFSAPNQYQFDGTETFAEFWLTETTATSSPHIDIDVTDGSATDLDGDVIEDVNIEFADAVFRFFAGGTGESIGTQIAGKESNIAPGNQTLQLRSVVTNTSTMACETRIQNTQTIEMAYKCNNPTTCQGTPRVQVDDTYSVTPGNDNADTVDASNGNFDNVDLDFGVTGTATFTFDFNDAGQVQLYARKSIAASSPDPAYTISGTSNMFIVRPFGFDIDSSGLRAADWLDNNALDDSTAVNLSYAADADGSVFATAGHSSNTFSVTIRAVAWDSSETEDSDNDGVPDTGINLTNNATTPNFGQETANSELVDVISGNVQPTNVGSLFFGDALDFANGTITTNLAFDEVGIIDLIAALDTGDYLSGGSDVTTTHQNFGRFKPDRFTLADNSPTFENGCIAGSFTYMEESFYYGSGNEPAITVTAVNENGDTTDNYGDGGTSATDYWKLPTALTRAYDDNGVNNGTTFNDLAVASVIVTGDDNYDGIGIFTLSNTTIDRDSFMFDRASVDLNAAEGAPFTASVDLLIRVTAGSLTDADGVCYDGDGDGACEIDSSDDYTALTDTGGTVLSLNQLRFGRLQIGTAVGSELLPISVPFQTEYHDGTGFVVNTDDDCTLIDDVSPVNAIPDLILDNSIESTVTDGDIQICVAGGTSIFTLTNPTLVGGDGGLSFSAPGTSCVGYSDITLGLTALGINFLQYDWLADDGSYDDDPTGRVDFGLFEGPRSFIYIREPW
jgi:Family of unknown function (DUF6701)